ncbi:MAG: hypothetical protein ABMB14_39420, partial [Myxococcota bacterium]
MTTTRPSTPLAHLRIVPTAAGGWRLTVGDGSTRPVEGTIPAGPALDALLAAHAPAVERTRVMVAGSDVGYTRAEDEVGQRFAAALAAAGPAWAHLQVLRGR